MPGQAGYTALVKQGAFDADVMNQINTNFVNAAANSPGIVASSTNHNILYSAFTAVTLLAAGGPAGVYRITTRATVKTTITTATSWLISAAFTDDIHSQTPTVSTSSTMTANAIQTGTYTFYSTGVAAITFTPTATSADGGAISFDVVLERLL